MQYKLKTRWEFKCEKLISYNKFKLFIINLLNLKIQEFFQITVTFYTVDYNQLAPNMVIKFDNSDLSFIVIDAQKESQFSQGKNKFIATTINPVSELEKTNFYKKNMYSYIVLFSTFKEQ